MYLSKTSSKFCSKKAAVSALCRDRISLNDAKASDARSKLGKCTYTSKNYYICISMNSINKQVKYYTFHRSFESRISRVRLSCRIDYSTVLFSEIKRHDTSDDPPLEASIRNSVRPQASRIRSLRSKSFEDFERRKRQSCPDLVS